MTRRFVQALILLPLSSGLSAAAQDAWPRTVVRGVVVGPFGGPIHGAEVRLALPDLCFEGCLDSPGISGPDGAFRFETSRLGQYLLEVSAPGWASATVEIVLSSRELVHDVGTIQLRGPNCSQPSICDSEEPPPPVSVCTIALDPARHSRKVSVTVWGVLRLTDGQLWLVGENCRAPLQPRQDPAYESALRLVPPPIDSPEAPAFQATRADVSERIRRHKGLVLQATCIGRLETSQDAGHPQLILGEIEDVLEGPSK